MVSLATQDESNRFALATDTEYWACLCFQTREQKEYFLNALNILQFGERYLDGQEVAKQLGITLPDAEVPYKANVKPDPVWVEFTQEKSCEEEQHEDLPLAI